MIQVKSKFVVPFVEFLARLAMTVVCLAFAYEAFKGLSEWTVFCICVYMCTMFGLFSRWDDIPKFVSKFIRVRSLK